MKYNLETLRDAIGETDFKPSVKAWLFLRLNEIEKELRELLSRKYPQKLPYEKGVPRWRTILKEILGE